MVTDPDGYRIVVHSGELDVDLVRHWLSEARSLATRDNTAALERVGEARGLFGAWPNEALAGLDGAAAVVRQHDELRVSVAELHVQLQLDRGMFRDVIVELERLVDEYPYHEQFWIQLMEAFNKTSRQVEALRSYQRLGDLLAEVGLEPGQPARALEAEILAQQWTGPAGMEAEPDGPAPGRRARTAPELVFPRTTFFGRRAELSLLAEAIDAGRLVSIVGLGGSGKTRLAIEAADAHERAGATVHRVGLSGLAPSSPLLISIAAVVGLVNEEISTASVSAHLNKPGTLLLLDNCEHVLSESADLADSLLGAAPNLTILATCREPLQVEGEHEFRLGPLRAPDERDLSGSAPSVALFYERARSRVSWLEADEATLRLVGDICRAVDGLPLAIELAAAQVAYLAPVELRDRFASAPAAALTMNRRDGASLEDVLWWCWHLLSPGEQALFARLSVFADSWPPSAVEAVAPSIDMVHDDLAALVDHSLVEVVSVKGRTRYKMLRTVAAFAADRLEELGETSTAREAAVGWLQGVLNEFTVSEFLATAPAMDHVEPEHYNVLGVLTYLVDEERYSEAMSVAARVSGFWHHRGWWTEANRWGERLLAVDSLSRSERSVGHLILASSYIVMADPFATHRHFEKCVEYADGQPHDWVPFTAGVLALLSLEVPSVRTSEEYRELARTAAPRTSAPSVELSSAAAMRGHVAFFLHRFDESLAEFRLALSHCSEPGRPLLLGEIGECWSLYSLGRVDEALRCARSFRSQPDTDDFHYIVDITRAVVEGAAGEPESATTTLAQVVRQLKPASLGGWVDDFNAAFAMLADFRGERALAEEIFELGFTRQHMLLTPVVDHLVRYRGLTRSREWKALAEELFRKSFMNSAGETVSVNELLDVWTTGLDPPLAEATDPHC